MSISVGILLFNDVEVLDFAGPYEVFTTASRVHKRLNPTMDAFKVFTVGKNEGYIQARAGLKVNPDYLLYQHPPIDVLIVPGGVVTAEVRDETVIKWITEVNRNTKLTASICTGAFLLAKAGFLDGKSATTHWEDIADLRADFPGIRVLENTRWVDEGKIITSAGISAGIDMSLHIVERCIDLQLATLTARQMEFDWQKN